MICIDNYESMGGIHGDYYRLSNAVAVKVVHSKVYSTIRKAQNSAAYRNALDEAAIIALAEETGVVPRCYGVTLVAVRGGYRVGILMQHLGQVTLADSEHYDDSEVYEHLYETLKDVGIDHHDLHEDNIMFYRGKFYAVDFSPECITVD